MLECGRYPQQLKRRIRGKGGHLSNDDAARLLKKTVDETKHDFRLQWACLCHLSEDNNCPEIARRTHTELLGDMVEIHVASRYGVSDVMEVK